MRKSSPSSAVLPPASSLSGITRAMRMNGRKRSMRSRANSTCSTPQFTTRPARQVSLTAIPSMKSSSSMAMRVRSVSYRSTEERLGVSRMSCARRMNSVMFSNLTVHEISGGRAIARSSLRCVIPASKSMARGLRRWDAGRAPYRSASARKRSSARWADSRSGV